MSRLRRTRAAVAWISMYTAAGATATVQLICRDNVEGRNHDGRPGVVALYDRRGMLAEVTIDADFDGRADVHEFFVHDMLVRRESDRDRDRRVDLVEEFDPRTGDHIRSEVDADRDGAVDFVVTFERGQPIVTWVDRSPARTPIADCASMRTLANRESPDKRSAFRWNREGWLVEQSPGLSTSGGLPRPVIDLTKSPSTVHSLRGRVDASFDSGGRLAESPRGPPSNA